jgi:sec-independent protein translocase protein TatB
MVRQVRNLATNARSQLKDQMGPEFDEVDWRQFDPRQYDPRRIVREALMEEPAPAGDVDARAGDVADQPDKPDKPQSGVMAPVPQPLHDPAKPTPWDADAT